MQDCIIESMVNDYDSLPLSKKEQIIIELLNDHGIMESEDYYLIFSSLPSFLNKYSSGKINSNQVIEYFLHYALGYFKHCLEELFDTAYGDLILNGAIIQPKNPDLIDFTHGF